MNYHNITHDDMLNGDGLRTVLWVAGCGHHCSECQNPETWAPDSGIEFSHFDMAELLGYLSRNYMSGLTISGGDPLYPGNRDKVTYISKVVKGLYPDKTVWVYTGYRYEEVCDLPIMEFVDVLVDGEYKKELRDVSLHWIGSSNQRLIDVQKSRLLGGIVLKKDA
jgi:anaerobic ribonucleoside-triphosphate reductase activating protein